MVAHDAIAAVPVAGTPQRDLMQALLISRCVYLIEDSEDPEALDPRNTATGERTLVLGYKGEFFWYDPDDSTTAHDGTTCIVTTDGGRYKVDTFDRQVLSVLDKDETTPPTESSSPPVEQGDAYLVPAGSTGDWSTHTDEVAVYTARGWQFLQPETGWILYVSDEQRFYHHTVGGSWTIGFGATLSSDDTNPLSSAINWGWQVIVENQTTNTPPSSPSVGDAYIIGSSPTGDWVGKSNQLAICETAGIFTIYDPPEGARIYDKATDQDYQYDGTTWNGAAASFTIVTQVYTANDTWAKPAKLLGAEVHLNGGGGGASESGGGGSGGNSSFGSHVSANGGGCPTGGTGGTGGDIHVPGGDGMTKPSTDDNDGTYPGGASPGPFGGGVPSYGGGGKTQSSTFAQQAGGGGEYAMKWINAADLGANESVTVGAAGAGDSTAEDGAAGVVVVREYIRA